MSLVGPTVSTWALQQLDSFVRYTGRHANVSRDGPVTLIGHLASIRSPLSPVRTRSPVN